MVGDITAKPYPKEHVLAATLTLIVLLISYINQYMYFKYL